MDENKKNNGLNPFALLLPKKLETGQEGKDILTVMNSHLKPVNQCNELMAPSFGLTEAIWNSLRSAMRTGRLIRGIEDAEKKLTAEKGGIIKVDKKAGYQRRERISRIVVIANDGSERFYRHVKKLIEQNQPRVLAIHLDITSFELGERLFGPGKRALLLLINHKEAVINFLTSLIK